MTFDDYSLSHFILAFEIRLNLLLGILSRHEIYNLE